MNLNQSVKCLIDDQGQPWVNKHLARMIFSTHTQDRWTLIKTLPNLIQVHDYNDRLIAVTATRQLLLINKKCPNGTDITPTIGKIRHSYLWRRGYIVLINEHYQLYCQSISKLASNCWTHLADDVMSITNDNNYLTWITELDDSIISIYNGHSINQFQINCSPVALINEFVVSDDMSVRIMEVFNDRQLRFDRFFKAWNFQAKYEIKDIALYPTDHVTILDWEGRTHRYSRNGKIHRIIKKKISRFIRDNHGVAYPVFEDGNVMINGSMVTEFKLLNVSE